jgi:hypothetical protein
MCCGVAMPRCPPVCPFRSLCCCLLRCWRGPPRHPLAVCLSLSYPVVCFPSHLSLAFLLLCVRCSCSLLAPVRLALRVWCCRFRRPPASHPLYSLLAHGTGVFGSFWCILSLHCTFVWKLRQVSILIPCDCPAWSCMPCVLSLSTLFLLATVLGFLNVSAVCCISL